MIPLLLFSALNRPAPTFYCAAESDLYRLIKPLAPGCRRAESPGAAVQMAPNSSTVLILGGELVAADLQVAHTKHLRVYEELPVGGGPSRPLEWDRLFVTSSDFGPQLPVGAILSLGRQTIRVEQAGEPLLAAGRIAGFDHLVFGRPPSWNPILWTTKQGELVAAAPLSQFVTARFSPCQGWDVVWKTILRKLGEEKLAEKLRWVPAVTPRFSCESRLPKSAEAEAVRCATTWFVRSHLLVTPQAEKVYAKADQWPDRVGPSPTNDGDGSLGILEGYSSRVLLDGRQPVRWYRRADCNAESAMACALSRDPAIQDIGKNLAEFIALRSIASQGEHADPKSPLFGLVGWNDTGPGPSTFYGDDNARYILGLIGAAGALNDHALDKPILACILGNFATTGVQGFRGDALWAGDIRRLGRDHFFQANTVNMAPHFEAYLWACELWAYSKTGYRPLLTRAEHAIRTTLMAGESAWTWTNGLQQERARMLLPLAWLVRVEDTKEHREWLEAMVAKVVSKQVACGAIQEEIGAPGHGIAGPPTSNEAYGTAETPMLQENSDPLADLLYTSNFAFLGLHEAAAVGCRTAKDAENRLANFLCRIQIKSDSHPELDGAWFRGFDFGAWDYWASNADAGWGAWSIETGWSVAWITSVLAMRQRHQSLWELEQDFHADRTLVNAFEQLGS